MQAAPIHLVSPPHIAIVRFSALGDVALAAAAVRQLRRCLPDATLTWITSPLGYALLQGMEGVQFEVYDKPATLADYRAFYRAFSRRRFDVVLALQANLRINLLYPALHAPIKIGFDRTRAREGQWLFCNRAIPFKNEHLLDSFLAFTHLLGCEPQVAEWALPLSAEDTAWAQSAIRALPHPLLAIHPCASKPERNWPLERLETVIRAAKSKWGCGFVFTGGNHPREREACRRLASVAGDNARDLCGLTTPKQLTALLGAVDGLIAPDTAAIHLARAMNTPVLGLYAVAPPALSGPYQRGGYVVNRYPDALRRVLGKDAARVKWNARVHHPDAMRCIETDDVLQQLARLLAR
ncbi:MAG: lipopolysaccharide heptosyltransferase family protein [Gallionellaceae bacterium]|nr:MAG: lipopolysaccharide heptosyltransferase family protein [Gallionellaceae bacterium]